MNSYPLHTEQNASITQRGVFSNLSLFVSAFSTQQRVPKFFVLSLSCIISLLQNKCFKLSRQSSADFEVVAK